MDETPLSALRPNTLEAFLRSRPGGDVGRPRSLSGDHLERALIALHEAGDPEALYDDRGHPWMENDAMRTFALAQAEHRRIASLSTAVVFAAFAAEAYINEYLGALAKDYGREDRKALDHMRVLQKYLFGPKIVSGKRLFVRGKPPIPELEALFTLRNKLAHPKPGFGPGLIFDGPGDYERAFSATRIASQIVHVSVAAIVLVRAAFKEQLDIPADIVWFGRGPILAYGVKAEKLPQFDAQPERPLFAQALDTVLAEVAATATRIPTTHRTLGPPA